MSTSAQPGAKAQLLTTLQAQDALSGVQITYGHPGKNLKDEIIMLGNMKGQQDTVGLGGGHRHETTQLDVIVEVVHKGWTQQQVTERAYVLMGHVEDAIRADQTLSGVANIDAQVTGPLALSEIFTPDGWGANLTFNVQIRARI